MADPIKCGSLRLKFDQPWLQHIWHPNGRTTRPLIDVFAGRATLRIAEQSPLEAHDPSGGVSDQTAADALHAAIMASDDPAVVRFREEWMSDREEVPR